MFGHVSCLRKVSQSGAHVRNCLIVAASVARISLLECGLLDTDDVEADADDGLDCETSLHICHISGRLALPPPLVRQAVLHLPISDDRAALHAHPQPASSCTASLTRLHLLIAAVLSCD